MMVSGPMSRPCFWWWVSQRVHTAVGGQGAAVSELPAVRVVETQFAVGSAADGVAALMDEAVVEPAQRQQVGQVIESPQPTARESARGTRSRRPRGDVFWALSEYARGICFRSRGHC
jgi:hypothetical protein